MLGERVDACCAEAERLLGVQQSVASEAFAAWDREQAAEARLHTWEVRLAQRPVQRRGFENLNVVSLNANGRLGCSHRIHAWLLQLEFWSGLPDIVAVQELDTYRGKESNLQVPGWKIFRHWPGPGSRACAFLVRSSVVPMIAWKKWLGRAGVVVLKDAEEKCLIVSQVHGAHGSSLLAESLTALADLISRCPRWAPAIAVGDWNIDLLPIAELDVGKHRPGRAARHADERGLLRCFLDAKRLQLVEHSGMVGLPDGHWRIEALSSPFTRVPWAGWGEALTLPSLLDYAAVRNVQCTTSILWAAALADHAPVWVKVEWAAMPPLKPKKSWQIAEGVDEMKCAEGIVVEMPSERCDYATFCSAAEKLQALTSDACTCKSRHAQRLPFQVRVDLRKAAELVDEEARRAAKRRAWAAMRRHVKSMATKSLAAAVRAGKAIKRTSNLRKIQKLTLVDDAVVCEPADVLERIAVHFEEKWLCNSFAKRSCYAEFLEKLAGLSAPWQFDDIKRALANVKARKFVMHDGCSAAVLAPLAHAYGDRMVAWLAEAACSPALASEFVVHARVLGKSTVAPTLSEVRMILPLPPALQLLDWLVADSVQRWVEKVAPLPEHYFCGAIKGTQPCDIVAGVSRALERFDDDGGRGAVAQADVKHFYDSIDCVLIGQWMLRAGAPPWMVAAILVLQMNVKIVLQLDGASRELKERFVGCLTGSRVAGVCGLLIVRDCMIAHARLRDCFNFHGFRFGLASWVDNMYSLGRSASEAVEKLEVFEVLLQGRWRLCFKDVSRQVFSMRNSEQDKDCRAYKWSSPFKVLGCSVGRAGTAWPDFDEAYLAVWRRLWAGAKSRNASKLQFDLKLKEISRVCWPSIGYRCSWWPVGSTLLGRVESLQNSIVACLLRLPPEAGESADSYVRRRGREARKIVRSSECWRLKVCERVVSWHEHVERGHVFSWAVEVQKCRGSTWLQGQRLLNNSFSAFAGILSLRANPGRPHVRWDEGVATAKLELEIGR